MLTWYKYTIYLNKAALIFLFTMVCSFNCIAGEKNNFEIYIEAGFKNNLIHVNWDFRQLESIITYFELLSSVNGADFFEVHAAEIDDHSQHQTFSYRLAPIGLINYFYIKAYDIDGNVHYSRITTSAAEAAPLSIFPNPASAQTQFVANTPIDQNVEFNLYTDQGKLVRSKNLMLKKGSNVFQYDVSTLNKGQYYIRAKFSGQNINIRFLKN